MISEVHWDRVEQSKLRVMSYLTEYNNIYKFNKFIKCLKQKHTPNQKKQYFHVHTVWSEWCGCGNTKKKHLIFIK